MIVRKGPSNKQHFLDPDDYAVQKSCTKSIVNVLVVEISVHQRVNAHRVRIR
jgi:hypothetical protein